MYIHENYISLLYAATTTSASVKKEKSGNFFWSRYVCMAISKFMYQYNA